MLLLFTPGFWQFIQHLEVIAKDGTDDTSAGPIYDMLQAVGSMGTTLEVDRSSTKTTELWNVLVSNWSQLVDLAKHGAPSQEDREAELIFQEVGIEPPTPKPTKRPCACACTCASPLAHEGQHGPADSAEEEAAGADEAAAGDAGAAATADGEAAKTDSTGTRSTRADSVEEKEKEEGPLSKTLSTRSIASRRSVIRTGSTSSAATFRSHSRRSSSASDGPATDLADPPLPFVSIGIQTESFEAAAPSPSAASVRSTASKKKKAAKAHRTPSKLRASGGKRMKKVGSKLAPAFRLAKGLATPKVAGKPRGGLPKPVVNTASDAASDADADADGLAWEQVTHSDEDPAADDDNDDDDDDGDDNDDNDNSDDDNDGSVTGATRPAAAVGTGVSVHDSTGAALLTVTHASADLQLHSAVSTCTIAASATAAAPTVDAPAAAASERPQHDRLKGLSSSSKSSPSSGRARTPNASTPKGGKALGPEAILGKMAMSAASASRRTLGSRQGPAAYTAVGPELGKVGHL